MGLDDVKGKTKEKAGDATGDDDLKNEGKVDQGVDKVKGAADDVADKAKDIVGK